MNSSSIDYYWKNWSYCGKLYQGTTNSLDNRTSNEAGAHKGGLEVAVPCESVSSKASGCRRPPGGLRKAERVSQAERVAGARIRRRQ